MTFLKKKWQFPKKKVMVVKNHINWKSHKFSSTMTLRKKTSWLVKTRNKWLFDKFQPNHDVFGKICKKLFALWNLWSWCFFFHEKFFHHYISDWNLMFVEILKNFPTMTFLKKMTFSKKKVTVVKNHINWKSDKFSSTMTLRKKNVIVGKNEK